MQTHQLKRKTANRTSKLVGRGGKRGKTAGRGNKGQNARAGHKKRPEIRDMIKKIPKLRGRGVNIFQSFKTPFRVITISDLNTNFKSGERVTPAVLFEKGLIRKASGQVEAVKILSGGELDKKLIIRNCTVSSTAKATIEKAGGKIE